MNNKTTPSREAHRFPLQRLPLVWSLSLCLVSNVALNNDAGAALLKPTRDASVSYQSSGKIQFVVGRITINEPAERVWPILANPFEFEERISPKFNTVHLRTRFPSG